MRAPVLVAAEHAVAVAPEHELAVEDGERERRVVRHLLGQVQRVPLLLPVVASRRRRCLRGLLPLPLLGQQHPGLLHHRRPAPPRPRPPPAPTSRPPCGGRRRGALATWSHGNGGRGDAEEERCQWRWGRRHVWSHFAFGWPTALDLCGILLRIKPFTRLHESRATHTAHGTRLTALA